MSRPILPNSQGSPHLPQHSQLPPQEPASPQFHAQPSAVDPSQYVPATQDQSIHAATSPTAPLHSPTQTGQSSSTPSKPTYAKRGKITIVACVPCRKRKTKCDGQRPSCTQCLSRNGPCSYDMTDDQRKLTFLRGEVEQLEEKTGVLEGLLSTIQTASNEEAAEVFRRIRFGGDLHAVANDVNAGRLLSGVGGAAPVRSDVEERRREVASRRVQPRLDHYERLVRALALADAPGSQDIVRRLKNSEEIPFILKNISRGNQDSTQLVQRRTPTGVEGKFSSQEHTFGMVKGAEMHTTHVSLGQESEFEVGHVHSAWTTVTPDDELRHHLVNLYFTWQHSFFQSFPENLFRADMAAGRSKYCSPMLVNAICAAGCFFSDRPGTDGLVGKFHDEAVRLYKENNKPTITTTATLYLISYVEGTRGQLSALWMSSGASSLMAVDLNLQLRRLVKPSANREQEQEQKNEATARAHAFWGCFHVDQITAFTLGRLPNFNIHGVTVDFPEVHVEEDQQPWQPYSVNGSHKPGAQSSTFRSCADLSTIVNGTLHLFFAPTVPLSGSLLVEEFQKYLDWKENLPAILSRTDDAPPHVLCLHMYYWTAVLLLFRPFLKAKILSRPELVPREICRMAADNISDIWSQHQRLYNFAGIYMFQVHCLLTACTIHIISIPSPSPTVRFATACTAFQDLSSTCQWAMSAIQILRNLARKWSLILPKDAEAALYRDLGGQPESPEIQPTMSPPSFTQPTNPAHAFSTDQQFLPQQSNSTSQSVLSNIDPALSSVPSPSTIPSTKRTASQMSQQLTAGNAMQPHSESFPNMTQKRPRIVAGSPAQTAASAVTPGVAPMGHVSSPSNATFNQPIQDPGSYLYAPLANQPPPLLVPVRQHPTQSGSNATGAGQAAQLTTQSQQQEAQRREHSSLPAAAALANSSTESTPANATSVKAEDGAENANTSLAANPAPGLSQSQGAQTSQQTQQPAGAQASAQVSEQVTANPTSVEGLSFSDDFRDPFMGFLEVD